MEFFHSPAATLWVLPVLALAIAIEAFLCWLSLIIAIGHNAAGIVNHVDSEARAARMDIQYAVRAPCASRLFGTYKEERWRDAALRLVHPIATDNPLQIVYGDFVALAREVRAALTWRERFCLVFEPPGWTPSAGR